MKSKSPSEEGTCIHRGLAWHTHVQEIKRASTTGVRARMRCRGHVYGRVGSSDERLVIIEYSYMSNYIHTHLYIPELCLFRGPGEGCKTPTVLSTLISQNFASKYHFPPNRNGAT